MQQTPQKVLMFPNIPAAAAAPVRVDSRLTAADRLAAWKARWGIDRMAYRLKPGLYALGEPSAAAPVFVTSNYKLSFDALRCGLNGLCAWLLVLDTRGINVWCAAGKGTFGTLELARSIKETGLEKLVSHRTVILPQLGAPGVSAHKAKAITGFTAVYGPARAEDLPEFLRLGNRATPAMRRVRFNFRDRMVLAPVQLVYFARYFAPAAALLWLAGLRTDAALTLLALLAGSLAVPALLPWLPGRSFAVKSAAAGLLAVLAFGWLAGLSLFSLCARALIYGAAASFVGLDFTGASTYTSLSGVKKEMRVALPAQALAFAAGAALLAAGKFL